jgi:hypothetical protein
MAPDLSELLKMPGFGGCRVGGCSAGLPAVFIGILVFFALPDRPRDAKF